jgi:hypothetical protein
MSLRKPGLRLLIKIEAMVRDRCRQGSTLSAIQQTRSASLSGQPFDSKELGAPRSSVRFGTSVALPDVLEVQTDDSTNKPGGEMNLQAELDRLTCSAYLLTRRSSDGVEMSEEEFRAQLRKAYVQLASVHIEAHSNVLGEAALA